jgi:hypothetical protein
VAAMANIDSYAAKPANPNTAMMGQRSTEPIYYPGRPY